MRVCVCGVEGDSAEILNGHHHVSPHVKFITMATEEALEVHEGPYSTQSFNKHLVTFLAPEFRHQTCDQRCQLNTKLN